MLSCFTAAHHHVQIQVSMHILTCSGQQDRFVRHWTSDGSCHSGISVQISRSSALNCLPAASHERPKRSRRPYVSCSSRNIMYRCPTCLQPLREKDKSMLECGSGHTILRAKEGYIHLLPSGRKAAVNAAGDSLEMVVL